MNSSLPLVKSLMSNHPRPVYRLQACLIVLLGALLLPPAPASAACSYDSGLASGLPGDYFNNMDLTDPAAAMRVDGPVNFDWGSGSPDVSGIGDDQFSVRWEGVLRVTSSDIYRFRTVSDDGVRLWVDGNLVIDNWTDHAATTDTSSDVSLSAGEVYDIRLEYYENGGQSEIRLRWGRQSGGFNYAPIPAGPEPAYDEGLYYCDDATVPGADAEYRMDAESWNGTPGEVIDSSGSGNNGTARNGANTAGTMPAIPGDPGTCRYGTFDGIDDYVEVGDLSALEGTATLTFWIRTPAGYTGSDTAWQAPGVAGIEEANQQDDIFWGWVDGSGRIGLSTGNDFDDEQKSNTSINDGNWYHVALTRDASSGETQVFIDGNLESTGDSVPVDVDTEFTSIGRIEDDGDSPEYLNADLDEVRVYGRVLSSSEVSQVRDAARSCPGSGGGACAADFPVYSGGQLQTQDGVQMNGNNVPSGQNGNAIALDGTRSNESFDLPGLDPASFPSNDESDDPAPADNIPSGNYGQIQAGWPTVTFSDSGGTYHIDQLQVSDWATVELAPGTYFIDQLDIGEGTELVVTGAGAVDIHVGDQAQLRNSSEINAGGSAGDFTFHLHDASLDIGSRADVTALVYGPGSGSDVTIREGGWGTTVFNGAINAGGDVTLEEDIEFSSGASASSALAELSCGEIDGFVIAHDGAGINCRPEPVTVTAVDSDGNAVTDYDGSISISTSTGNGDWSIGSGSGTLTGGGGDDGSAAYAFGSADQGEVELLMSDTHQESVNVDVTDGDVTDTDVEGDIVFRPYGFELEPLTIPTQIAGHPFDVTLTAVGELPSDPGCNVIEEYSGSRNIKFWFDYENPASGTIQVQVDGNAIAADGGAATDQLVTFSNGSATIPVVYADAGRIQLHARDDAGIGEPPAGSASEIVAGGTNPFVVRPFGLEVEVPADTSATGVGGDLLERAGHDFDVTVTARAWASEDDDNPQNGVPDNDADLSNNAATPNFGQESPAEAVDITHSVANLAGVPDEVDGNLTNTNFTGFTNGSRTRVMSWDEVGYLNLSAALDDGDYLGSGEDVIGSVDMVGRFAPDHFTLSGTSLTQRVNHGCTSASFTYIGEAFATGFTLTAHARGGSVTTNYEGTYARLDSIAELDFGAVAGGTDLSSRVDPSDVVFDWDEGVGNWSADLVLERQDPEGPYVPLRVGIAPSDEDTVTLQASALDLDVDGTASHAETAAPELRFGRMVVDSAGGAEIAPIDVPLRTEYWTGDTWNVNGLDSCTTFGLGSEVQLFNGTDTVFGNQPIAVGGGQTSITSGDPVLSGGVATVTFFAPGADNTGWVDLTALLGAGSPDYSFLRGDPEDDGSWGTNPSGRVTFGIYGGNDRWIDIRRVPVN